MKNARKEILRIVVICVAVLLIYVVLDSFNVPSRMGMPIQHINWDAAGLFCGNLVALALFAITYQVLDKRSVQKEHNRRRVAVNMLRSVMATCTTQIRLLKKPRVIAAILKRIDFDKLADDEPNYHKLLTIPFADHESIVSFASEGVISEEEFTAYHGIKESYCMLITCLITFHDMDEIKVIAEESFNTAMRKAEEIFNRE